MPGMMPERNRNTQIPKKAIGGAATLKDIKTQLACMVIGIQCERMVEIINEATTKTVIEDAKQQPRDVITYKDLRVGASIPVAGPEKSQPTKPQQQTEISKKEGQDGIEID